MEMKVAVILTLSGATGKVLRFRFEAS